MILNLGCGKNIMKDCVNVDVTPYKGVNQVVDLSKFPWPWADESIDGINASHLIEHFPYQEVFIYECLRVLKKGGFLRLKLPHCSNVTSAGCMGHYRTYSYDTFKDYLSRDFYMFKTKRFETVEQRLRWWYELTDCQGELPGWMIPIIKAVDYVLTRLANISPRVCENLWCYWVGGFREVVWKGIKV